jgi:PIN domain nuclease of toxin-antitoxin system
VTVLDAYAVIAYLRREPAGAAVKPLLQGPTLLCAANAAEVVDQLVRVHAQNLDKVEVNLAILNRIGMTITPVTEPIAILAGILRARHYDKRTAAVSHADCLAAATALRESQPLATADPPLARLVRAEGGKVIALGETKGRRP